MRATFQRNPCLYNFCKQHSLRHFRHITSFAPDRATPRSMQHVLGDKLPSIIFGGSNFGPTVGVLPQQLQPRAIEYVEGKGSIVELMSEARRDLMEVAYPALTKNNVSFIGSVKVFAPSKNAPTAIPQNVILIGDLKDTHKSVEAAIRELLDQLDMTGKLDMLVVRGLDALARSVSQAKFEAHVAAIFGVLEWAVAEGLILSYGVYSNGLALPVEVPAAIPLRNLLNVAKRVSRAEEHNFRFIGCPVSIASNHFFGTDSFFLAKETDMLIIGLDPTEGREPDGEMLSLYSYKALPEGTEREHAEKFQELLNNTMALEALYPDMCKKHHMSNLPSPVKLAWAQILVANQKQLTNPFAWHYTLEYSVKPVLREVIYELSQVDKFSQWAQEYSDKIYRVFEMMEEAILHSASFRANDLCNYLDQEVPELRKYPTLQEKSMIVALCCGVDTVATTRLDFLPKEDGALALPFSPDQARQVMGLCKNWLAAHPVGSTKEPEVKIMEK